MLARSSLPIDLWDHNFPITIYLIKILPTYALDKYVSPLYALHHKQLDYKILKVFRCSFYPHPRPYKQHKMNLGSIKCVYLGMSPSYKGHKCMAPDGRVYISKDVVFNDS